MKKKRKLNQRKKGGGVIKAACILVALAAMAVAFYETNAFYDLEYVHLHAFRREVVSPTCTSKGYTNFICIFCGYTYADRFVDALGHDYSIKESVEADCESAGYIKYTCSVCRNSYYESYTEALGHAFSDNVCLRCGSYDWSVVDLSFFDRYNSRYGYNYLGTLPNAANYQAFYDEIDLEVRRIHAAVTDCRDGVAAVVDFSRYGLEADQAISIWKVYRCDNPLYYWLSTKAAYTSSTLKLLIGEEYASAEVRSYYNDIVYSAVDSVLREEEGKDVKRIVYDLHNFIINQVDYAYQSDGRTPESALWAHSVLGVLNSRGAVCKGYAKTFQLLLNVLGIDNVIVTGTAQGEEHVWNLVKVGESYYCFDLTWDDLGARGISYRYYGLSGASFSFTHTPETQYGIGIEFLYELPECSSKGLVS